ncbi:MAG: CaiB/BaiF CoA transferase family protein [Dehalococcoidia bacterium]
MFQQATDKKGALEGIRVADFTSAWAGPHCVSLLAFMGAQVIKIESRAKPDLGRFYPPFYRGQPDLDGAVWFNQLHRRSLSVSLNLRTQEGIELSKRIVGVCDIVVENFRAGVMDKLGLGYPVLVQINPQIIMAAVSGFGAYGPKARWVTYGMHVSNISGLMSNVGFPTSDPVPDWVELPDPSGGVAGAGAILAALHYRSRTGKGQYIDVSELETVVGFQPQKLMGYQMNGTEPARMGNRDEVMVPHGVYPCKGQDEWVSIAVANDEEWSAFCAVLGKPEPARDERFSSALARKRNEDQLDQLISEWTRQHTKFEVAEKLQAAGVAAVPTFTSADLFRDKHLQERGFFEWNEHPIQGRARMPARVWHMKETPLIFGRPSPLIGQHNRYVLGELLGVSDREIRELEHQQVVY